MLSLMHFWTWCCMYTIWHPDMTEGALSVSCTVWGADVSYCIRWCSTDLIYTPTTWCCHFIDFSSHTVCSSSVLIFIRFILAGFRIGWILLFYFAFPVILIYLSLHWSELLGSLSSWHDISLLLYKNIYTTEKTFLRNLGLFGMIFICCLKWQFKVSCP